VYRLVVKGTVEERILQRAEEKSEVWDHVIHLVSHLVHFYCIDTKDGDYRRGIPIRHAQTKRGSVTSP